jgi:hypothetical protein
MIYPHEGEDGKNMMAPTCLQNTIKYIRLGATTDKRMGRGKNDGSNGGGWWFARGAPK